MAYIYKITNLINNKVYIGETIRNIYTRWNEHKHEALKEGHGFSYPLHSAMRKYGVENFSLELIEECKDDERFEREKYYIQKHMSFNKDCGYNIVLEGTGATLYSTQDIINLWNQGLGISQIASQLGCHRSVVSERLHGIFSEEEIKKRTSEISSSRQGIPIYQYDLKGNFIREWPSASECARVTGYTQTALNAVCRQEQFSAYNFLWKTVEDNRPISQWVEKNMIKGTGGKPKKKVGQYDIKTNNLICIYDSASEAAKAMEKKDKSGICRAARLNGTSVGYKWKYEEE